MCRFARRRPTWTSTWMRRELFRINQELESIMADQDTLNAYVARLGVAVAAIRDEIDMLKNQPGSASLDFSGLESAVAGVEGLEAPAAPPSE